MTRSALLLLGLLLLVPARAQDAPPPTPAGDELEELRAAAFAPEVLRARRLALLAALPAGAVVIVAAPAHVDDTWPYRPSPDFLWLTGVREPGYTLLLAEGIDLLLAPRKDTNHELWNGPRLAPGAEDTGFQAVVDRAELPRRLSALLPTAEKLWLSGVELPALELPGAEGGATPPGPGAQGTPPSGDPREQLHALRQVKDGGELALLQRAIDITGAGLVEAMRSAAPGRVEYELQAVIEYLFLRHGAQRPGFASIVGSGPNSCVLHYQSNRRRTAAGDLVVMDVGAELWGYTADVTRTVPVGGKFTPRQREIYELVLRAQEEGFKAVRPGATIRQVDAAARRVIREAGHAGRFPHGTSHWLGMDVHDVGAYSRPFEPGMVLTVEPGVYLAEEGIGVRIEDDVLVTEDGYRVLSAGIPRTVEALEALLARRDGVGARDAAPVPAREPAPRRERSRRREF